MIQALGPRAEGGCLRGGGTGLSHSDWHSRCAMPSPYATLIDAMLPVFLMKALSAAFLARSPALPVPAALLIAGPLSCEAVVVCLSMEG